MRSQVVQLTDWVTYSVTGNNEGGSEIAILVGQASRLSVQE